MARVEIIAEAGVNHNGSLERALEMIDAAHAAGADTVKFQTFRAELVVTASAPKAEYQERATGAAESQRDMVRALELGVPEHHRLQAHARARGIEFLSTPFDEPSVGVLREMGLGRLKIPSGEITNPLLLRAAARTGVPLIVSSGMATLGELEETLGVLAAEWLAATGGERLAPARAFASDAGQRLLAERVTLLHCTTEYPAPPEAVNLRAMETMRAAFGLPVGYSDHTLGTMVAIAAAALGAVVIEKHFTLDRRLPGPDHAASLEPGELTELVRGVRAVSAALGDGRKRPAPAELKNMPIARRSLVAARPIRRGETLTLENVTAKRPGTGISPMRIDEVLGRTAARDYAEDELID